MITVTEPNALERAPERVETERARRRGEEPYSRTVTTPGAGLAKGSARHGARSRGMTLVELIIVITIIGVMTAAIAIGVMGAANKANMGAAKTACDTVRQATIQWKALHSGEDCPTVDQLKSEKDLDTGFSVKDPWGTPFRLSCESDEITCTSSGPDKKDGTGDDIIVPKPDQSSEGK